MQVTSLVQHAETIYGMVHSVALLKLRRLVQFPESSRPAHHQTLWYMAILPAIKTSLCSLDTFPERPLEQLAEQVSRRLH